MINDRRTQSNATATGISITGTETDYYEFWNYYRLLETVQLMQTAAMTEKEFPEFTPKTISQLTLFD